MSETVDTAALGPPIKGPAAFSGDLRRFLTLTKTMAVMEFKVRFFGSALGYLWQLFRPLLLFSVLFVVFTEFVRINGGVKFFPAMLLLGIVLFTFFSDATASAVTSVADKENLVRKIEFPRLVVPLAVVLTAGFNLGLNLLAVLIFMLGTGVEPGLTWLLVPLPLLALAVFAVGVSMFLSALYPRFRDLSPIWDVLLQMLFYGSPILYAIEVIPDNLRELVMLNPLAAIIQQTRHWLIDPGAPTAAEAAGGAVYLLVPAAMVVGIFVLGYWVFSREAPRIAEEL